MLFLTFAEIGKNLESYGLEHLNLEILSQRFNLLKRDIEMELVTSDNQANGIKKQIIKFEGKFDLENSKWFFEDRGEYGMNYLRNWYAGSKKKLPVSIERWYDIDPTFEKMGDIALRELHNDLKIIIWLYSILPPSVSKPKTKKAIPINNEKKNKPATIRKYENITKQYKELTKIEGIKHDKAIEKLCKDFRCSEFTIDRALKQSN